MNVLVVDPHAIYRHGLVAALSAADDVDDVRQAGSVADVRSSDLLDGVHVVLVDTEVDDAVDLLRSLREAPWPKAIACAHDDDLNGSSRRSKPARSGSSPSGP